jgi:hypothetical protein
LAARPLGGSAVAAALDGAALKLPLSAPIFALPPAAPYEPFGLNSASAQAVRVNRAAMEIE